MEDAFNTSPKRTFEMAAEKTSKASEEALEKAQALFLEFTERTEKISQNIRKIDQNIEKIDRLKQSNEPFIANRIKVIVSDIRDLLKTAGEDPSVLSTNGGKDDLSVAAYNACIESAKARLFLLSHLFQGSKRGIPKTGREIQLTVEKIEDLLNYAGAKGHELDPYGKIPNKEMIPRIAFFANIESAKLRGAATELTGLPLVALETNLREIERLSKKYNFQSTNPSDFNKTRKIIDVIEPNAEVIARPTLPSGPGFKPPESGFKMPRHDFKMPGSDFRPPDF